MRRIFVIAILGTAALLLALVPGMDKTRFGGSIGVWPFPLWVSANGYYMEGMQIYEVKNQNVFVDLYVGPTAGAGFLSLGYVTGLGFDLGLRAEAFIYKADFNLELFGYKFIPALEVYAVAHYTFGNASTFDYNISSGGFGVYYGFSIPFLLQRPESGEWVAFYFWPFPLVIGFDVVKF